LAFKNSFIGQHVIKPKENYQLQENKGEKYNNRLRNFINEVNGDKGSMVTSKQEDLSR